MSGALVVGEALVDVVRRPGEPEVAHAGGSAANVAVALGRLGRPVSLATCFADDDHGRLISSHLDRSGVALAVDPHVVQATSTALATIGADGAATYDFQLDWRPALSSTDVGVPLVVHVGSLGALLPPGADDVERLVGVLRATSTVSYDVNARPQVTGTGADVRARVERLASLSDVVKASDEDLLALWPGRSVEESLVALAGLGPAVVVATRGGEGASYVVAGVVHHAPAVRAEVVDTIGAGDTFAAGLVDSLWSAGLLGAAQRERLHGLTAEDWQGHVARAATLASVTVSRPGADPPWAHEL